jgi:hypothetical protein
MMRRRALLVAAGLIAGAALAPPAAYADGMSPAVLAPVAAIALALVGAVVAVVVAATVLLFLHFFRKSHPGKPLAPVPSASPGSPADQPKGAEEEDHW